MPSCPFVHQIHQSKGQKVPKSGAFKNEGVHEDPWSNSQTEGQINRLKTLKRAMYGRAGVELLRARMMPLPTFTEHEM